MGKKSKQQKVTVSPVAADKPIEYTLTADKVTPVDDHTVRLVSGLKDTGARTQSITGALREPDPVDVANVRPRYDLIPAKERAEIMHATHCARFESLEDELNEVLSGNTGHVGQEELYGALGEIGGAVLAAMGTSLQAWKRLAIHYGRGALKYDDRNWEKGLETGRTIASLMRHLQQAKEGLTDEDHLAATLWNVIALMWTIRMIESGARPAALDTYKLLGDA